MTTTAAAPVRQPTTTHWIVYAIVPAGAELPEFDDAEPEAADRRLELLSHGSVAAVVEAIPSHHRLRRAEILAHNAIANALALDGPTIPVAFGSVFADAHQIVDDLLVEHADDLLATLERLRHKHQFIVRLQYRMQELLTTIVASDDDVAALRRESLARPGRTVKLQLGNECRRPSRLTSVPM